MRRSIFYNAASIAVTTLVGMVTAVCVVWAAGCWFAILWRILCAGWRWGMGA